MYKVIFDLLKTEIQKFGTSKQSNFVQTIFLA